MSPTPLNRSLHTCLFRFVDFYYFFLSSIWSNTSAGGSRQGSDSAASTFATSAVARRHLLFTRLSRWRHLERHICLETYETILSFCQRNGAHTFKSSPLSDRGSASVWIHLSVQMCAQIVQMCADARLMFGAICSCEAGKNPQKPRRGRPGGSESTFLFLAASLTLRGP